MFGLTPIQILIVVVIGFLVFGVGGSKKLFRRGTKRVKDTGSSIKGAAAELQTSFGEEADENSAVYRAAKASREKAAEGATVAIEAAKEARDEVAGLADDARAGATGEEPQTAIGRAARSVSDTARDVRAGVVGADDGEHEPQTAIGKAAKAVGDTAKARVDMLGETAAEFAAGVEGVPVVEPPSSEAAAAEAGATEPAAPAQLPAADGLAPAAPSEP
ncbi:MAG: twin-arginine translocase TatA/TatE family subunit [Thermoleophilia bacterium]|nr:twin-arginine translocase TatA/TatE family subunit [Thermoleophilia bacterium]